jgi:segregation and condensation protein A
MGDTDIKINADSGSDVPFALDCSETRLADDASSEITPLTDANASEAQVVVDESAEGFLPSTREVIYRISEFEGPLDLLLTLIKDAKINIEDIFVSDVTSQYVEIIKNTPKEELDFDYAGEFITLAAELVYLKSLRTLPKDEDEFDPEDPEIQRSALINKIKEYALLKEQSEKLREIETINRFYRTPVFTDKDYRVSLTNFSLPKLVEAFARVLANAEKMGQDIIPKKVIKDRFSVHEQMENIRHIIALYKEIDFVELFEPDFDRNDIVTTFLAVLELMKYGFLRAQQDETFGTIKLFAVEEKTEEAINFEDDEDGKY